VTGQTIVTVLLAVVGGAGASIITGLFGMPQVRAGAKATEATGEVAISGDAREWAKTFADRAERAEARADKADERADAVEQELEDCKQRCEAVETRLDNWMAYARRLQVALERQNIAVPPPPEPTNGRNTDH